MKIFLEIIKFKNIDIFLASTQSLSITEQNFIVDDGFVL